MNTEQKIIEILKRALCKLSDEEKIEKQNLRLKLTKVNGKLNVYLTDKVTVVKELSFSKAFGLNVIETPIVKSYLSKKMSQFISEYKTEDIQFKISPINVQCEPRGDLFVCGKHVKEIKIDQLLN